MQTKLFTALVFTSSLFVNNLSFAEDLVPITAMPSGIYQLDKTHASLTFKINHMGLSNYTARFTDFNAILTYDQKDPTKSTIEVTINPLSIRTDYPNPERINFDHELANKPEWFNVTKFPNITYKSKSVFISNDNKTGIVAGDLTMLGVTKPVSLNVTLNGAYKLKPMLQVPSFGFSATSEIKRSDWGMKNFIPTVGDQVTIIIEAEFNKQEQSA